MADKFDKAGLARLVKILEMLIMAVAMLGFFVHSLPYCSLPCFLLGLHSTLFGPVKYAILPQHLREEELVGGNALVEAGTFVAILVGTLAGGLLASMGGASELDRSGRPAGCRRRILRQSPYSRGTRSRSRAHN